MELTPVPKKAFLSKTVIANFIMALVAFIPSLADKVNMEVLAQVMVVVNMILRFVTKEKVVLW